MSTLAERRHPWGWVALVLTFVSLLTPNEARAENLSATEVAGITLGSVSVLGLGLWARSFDSTKTPLISTPLPLEMSVQQLLGGSYRPGKMNCLDSPVGSAYTPIAGGVLLLAADLAWPPESTGRQTAEDLFLYASGVVATKGVTSVFKGLIARPRPNTYLEPGISGDRLGRSYAHEHQSFFSGHTSSAFFAMAFLNKRLRSIMRQEFTNDEYRSWRWAPPSLLFGWASLVGVSRIHAHKHYLFDVLAGALAGYLMAELFYSFGNEDAIADSENGAKQVMLRITFTF